MYTHTHTHTHTHAHAQTHARTHTQMSVSDDDDDEDGHRFTIFYSLDATCEDEFVGDNGAQGSGGAALSPHGRSMVCVCACLQHVCVCVCLQYLVCSVCVWRERDR